MRNPLSTKPPGLKKAIRSKEPNVHRVNILINEGTATNFEKVKSILTNFGPELTNRKTGETGRPTPSASLILARLLTVYLAYLLKLQREGGKAALTEEVARVTEPDKVGAGAVKF